MKKEDVLQLPSMPLQSPTFPQGPFRFFNREYLIIQYRSEPQAIRDALPEPLEPAGDVVAVQWLDLPDGEGFGAYAAAAQIIPCTFAGKQCNFVSQMYVGKAKLEVHGDTLTGTLHYAGQQTATGTMVFKHDAFRPDIAKQQELLARTQITLKVIPDVDGKPAIAQLVGIEFENVKIHGAWSGEARLELIPAVNCPLADLPVKEVIGGLHMVTDMTLPYGRVLHDYLA
jgi:acetoacetate decarboxylase